MRYLRMFINNDAAWRSCGHSVTEVSVVLKSVANLQFVYPS
jgi:hypothetical protein